MKRRFQRGFALPTVVITGTVLFTVIMVILGSTASTRTVLDAQFYEALARDAAESGAQHVKSCINDPGFTVGITLTPQTNCSGVVQGGQPAYVVSNTSYRTTYSALVTQANADGKRASVSSTVGLLRTSNGTTWKTYSATSGVQTVVKPDPDGDRASKRFWYAGRSVGLDFGVSGSGAPTYFQAQGAPWTANEGTTVVTDKDGNLQFWSDGLKIWNKNGAAMAGSSGLIGAGSATQAVAAFPLNSARTKYGVVSNSGQGETGLGELYLHTIDMAQNGGLGAVTAKNQMLGIGKSLGNANSYNGNNIDKSYSSEGLGAMPKADGSGYFVYTYNAVSNRLIGFLIGINGVVDPTPITWTMNPLPTKCQIGAFSPVNNGNAPASGYGSFNYTNDYSKMLMLVGAWSCSSSTASGTMYYFNMNQMTGVPSLAASWTTYATGTTSSHANAYVADFSPQENYVYVSQIYPGEVTRYSLANLSNVGASQWHIGPTSLHNHATNGYLYAGGAIKRGPNGMMYIADGDAAAYNTPPCKMSYISDPDATTNTKAAIGWNIDAIALNPSSTSTGCSTLSLPQMATVYVSQVVIY